MIDNNNLIKYFVRVPVGVSFNGAEVSNANATNRKKIYFDENTQQIWVKGLSFSLEASQRTALATLIGTDTNMSVRAIAQDVVNNIASWQGADANEVIDTLKEVLTWFNNLPEGDQGALALVNKVGNPAVYYTAEEAAAYNTDNGLSEGDEGYKTTSDVKTAATGLYKIIEDSINAIDYSSFATKTEVNEKIGNLGNKTEAQAAQYYTQEEADAYNTEHSLNSGDAGFVTTETIKTPAIDAIPYTSVMEVIVDNELTTAAAINDLNDQIQGLDGESIKGITIGDNAVATVTDNMAYITTAAIQEELFDNAYSSNPLSYSYLGVTVSLKESNGELTYLNVDASELVSRVSTVEDFDPWEEYSAPTPEP